jgi:hypothetical protein
MRKRGFFIGLFFLVLLVTAAVFFYWDAHRKGVSSKASLPLTAAQVQSEYLKARQEKDWMSAQKRVTALMDRITPANAAYILKGLPYPINSDYDVIDIENLNVYTNVLLRWAQHDLTGAQAFVEGLTDPVQKEQLMNTVRVAQAKKNPHAVLLYLTSLPDEVSRFNSAKVLLPCIARSEPGQAIEWSGKFLNPAHAEELAPELYRVIAEKDPLRASGGALALSSVNARRAAIESIADSWSRNDPIAALKWSRQLQDETLRPSAYAHALSGWVVKDEKAACDYVLNMEPGEIQTQAAPSVVRPIAQFSPARAIAWANQLPKGPAREAAFVQIARIWIAHDPESAKKWISAAELPAATRRELLKYP